MTNQLWDLQYHFYNKLDLELLPYYTAFENINITVLRGPKAGGFRYQF